MSEIDFTALAAPFPADDIEWRAGATTQDKKKAMALAYITSRAIMDRLDAVVGPANWRDEYAPGPQGGVICGISLRIGDEWVTKWDGADNTDFEAVKGGLSDAFKRAGYKWGIGRYLYKLEGQWVPCEVYGKTVKLSQTPRLPGWALPEGAKQPSKPPVPDAPPDEPDDEPGAGMDLSTAENVTNRNGLRYGEMTSVQLRNVSNGIEVALRKPDLTDERRSELTFKRDAALMILRERRSNV